MTAPFRIGEGWDTHQLHAGRPLILGGVTIPHTMGLLGHSDADALCHAITDALLGAAALGDIGRHYPDSDPKYNDPVLGALLTGGSWSVRMNFDAMSRAGAAGRRRLVGGALDRAGDPVVHDLTGVGGLHAEQEADPVRRLATLLPREPEVAEKIAARLKPSSTSLVATI